MMFIKPLAMVFTIATLTLSSPLTTRSNGESVIEDLASVARDFYTLDTAIQRFNGSSEGANAVPPAVNALKVDLTNTANDTQYSNEFTSAESTTVKRAWDELKGAYNGSLEDVIAKKVQFEDLGMGAAMVDNFYSVRALTNSVSDEFKKKVAPLDIPVITLATAQMDGALQAAIQAYTT